MCTGFNSGLRSPDYGFFGNYLRGSFMKIIEKIKDLNDLLFAQSTTNDECILRVYDNKSNILLQTVVVKHPVIFIRGLQDFCKSVNLPVSDVSVHLIGFISENSNLVEIDDIVEISPYVYFNRPKEEVNSSEDN